MSLQLSITDAAQLGTAEALRQAIPSGADIIARASEGNNVLRFLDFNRHLNSETENDAAHEYIAPKYWAVRWLQLIERYPSVDSMYNKLPGTISDTSDERYLRELKQFGQRSFGVEAFKDDQILEYIYDYNTKFDNLETENFAQDPRVQRRLLFYLHVRVAEPFTV